MRLFWLSRSSKRHPLRAKPKPPSTRLALEVLEGRVVPSLTWSSGLALPGPRGGVAAIREADQSILVVGGGTTTVDQLASQGTAWTTANPIDAPRVSPGVANIGGSEVLVYGGSANGTALNTAQIYDPTSDDIQNAAPMSTARSLLAFATDGSNRAYAIGGLNAKGHRLNSVERYDPDNDHWSLVAALPKALSGATAVYDGAGHILIFGGTTATGKQTKAVLSYSVATNTWTTLASMPSAVSEAAAVLGPDGLIYVIGGKSGKNAVATVQVYNPAAKKWTTGVSFGSAVSDEAVVVDSLDRIEVLGGNNAHGSAASMVYQTQSLANVAPQITTTSLPGATVGENYVATVATFGAPAPQLTVLSGPTGLSINATTGIINWQPTTDQIGTQSVTLQASNVAGTVTQTFSLTVVPDTLPPTVPFLSVGTQTSTTAIPLTWTASTDDGAMAGYRLYSYTPAVYRGHSGRDGGITLVSPAKYTLLVDNIPPTTTSYTFTGLTPYSTYRYAVAAFDAAGNQSAYSPVVSVTTLQVPSISYSSNGVNTNPQVSVVANHSIYLTLWAAGSPAPTLSLVSAPSGVVFTPGVWTNSQLTIVIPNITWTPTASQVGVSHIIMLATNIVGTYTLDIPVTVTADVPVPSLSINGGLSYTVGNMTTVAGTPNDYQLAVNNGFDISGGSHPQYAFSGTPFSFQLTGTSNTNLTTYALVSGPATMKVDSSTGIGTWTPGPSDASAATNVTVSATNSAGTTLLTFTFPTYFTTAPTNVAVSFDTNTSGSASTSWIPVVTWTAPANANGIADYKVTVTSALTQATTVYDTQSTATSFALPAGITGQCWVNVTAYDANGNPSQTSTSNAPLYLAALPGLSWTFSSPTAVAGQSLSVQFAGGGAAYAIASGPAGVTIDPITGLLSWTPGLADIGTATIVVSAANNNGWGTVYATLSFPVYFTDAPTSLTVASSTDPVSSVTTWTASWNAPTMNTGNIVGYQISFLPGGSPTGTPPTLFTVPAANLSVVLSNLATLSGSVQVAAYDAAGDLGAPSTRLTF